MILFTSETLTNFYLNKALTMYSLNKIKLLIFFYIYNSIFAPWFFLQLYLVHIPGDKIHARPILCIISQFVPGTAGSLVIYFLAEDSSDQNRFNISMKRYSKHQINHQKVFMNQPGAHLYKKNLIKVNI